MRRCTLLCVTDLIINLLLEAAMIVWVYSIFWIQEGTQNMSFNEVLKDAEEANCQITWLKAYKCGLYNDGVGLQATGIVDICISSLGNVSIPWSGDVGPHDNCYVESKDETPMLPYPGHGYSENMTVNCRANCQNRVWYTNELYDNAEELQLRGIIFLILTSCYCCLFYVYTMWDKGEWVCNLCDKVCCKGSENDSDISIVSLNSIEMQSRIGDIDRSKFFRNYRNREAGEKNAHDDFKKKLQGDWRNSEGLLISVQGLTVTFLSSGNSYELFPKDDDGFKIPIGINWWHLNRYESSEDTVIWSSSMQGRITWHRRVPVRDFQPTYENSDIRIADRRVPVRDFPPTYENSDIRIANSGVSYVWKNTHIDLEQKLQGNWRDDEGLLISIRDNMVLFVASGNSHELCPFGKDRFKIRIRDEWWCYSHQSSEDYLIWSNSGNWITWERQDPANFFPPAHEHINLQMEANAPPAYEQAYDDVAPPTYEQAVPPRVYMI